MKFHLALNRCLEFWREQGGNRAQLAKEVGCSVASISHWVNDRRPIEHHFATKLFQVLADRLGPEYASALSDLSQGYSEKFPDRQSADAHDPRHLNGSQPLEQIAVASAKTTRDFPDKPSIAVLPLKLLSSNLEDAFLAEGLTEDLTTGLSGVPWLFVIAQSSAFTYSGRPIDVRQISQELGVRYILEGSVRRSGNRIRISAQLADATNGLQIWSHRYDGPLEDVFDFQDRIVREVVTAIGPKIQLAEIQKSIRKRPDDRSSYDIYLSALNQLNLMRVDDAQVLLLKALEDYPDYAGAKAMLAWCTTLRIAWRSKSKHEELRNKSEKYCVEALVSEQRDIETEAYAGYALAFHLHNKDFGMELVANAVEHCPSFSWAWTSRSFLESFFGDPERGLVFGKRALRLNPRGPLVFRTLHAVATAYIGICEYEKALESAQEGLNFCPNITSLQVKKISALVKMDRIQEARSEAESLLNYFPEFQASRFLSFREQFNNSDGIAEDLRASGLPE